MSRPIPDQHGRYAHAHPSLPSPLSLFIRVLGAPFPHINSITQLKTRPNSGLKNIESADAQEQREQYRRDALHKRYSLYSETAQVSQWRLPSPAPRQDNAADVGAFRPDPSVAGEPSGRHRYGSTMNGEVFFLDKVPHGKVHLPSPYATAFDVINGEPLESGRVSGLRVQIDDPQVAPDLDPMYLPHRNNFYVNGTPKKNLASEGNPLNLQPGDEASRPATPGGIRTYYRAAACPTALGARPDEGRAIKQPHGTYDPILGKWRQAPTDGSIRERDIEEHHDPQRRPVSPGPSMGVYDPIRNSWRIKPQTPRHETRLLYKPTTTQFQTDSSVRI